MKFIEINGENISSKEAMDLTRMLYHDAREVAGVFYDMNRSEKFRTNWPNQDRFADCNWKTFVEATRQLYAERLGDPNLDPVEGRKMHLALVLQAMMAKGEEADNRLQIAPNSAQFEGDNRENAKIMEKFGPNPNFRAALKNSVTPLFDTVH
jgi:hypothetical protein